MGWKNILIAGIFVFLITLGILFSLQFYAQGDISDYQDNAEEYYSNLIEGETDIQKAPQEKQQSLDPISVKEIKNSGLESTVLIESRTGSVINNGAGFVTENNYIITAAHVIRNSEDFKVEYSNGETEQANLVGKDLITDIAVLQPHGQPPVNGLEIKDKPIVNNNEAFIIGNPGGTGIEITSGKILETGQIIEYNEISSPEHFTIKANTEKGYSGGPILNKEGKVIGITRGKSTEKTFGVSNRIIKEVKNTILREDGDYNHKKPILDFSEVDITQGGSIVEKGLVASSQNNVDTKIRTFGQNNNKQKNVDIIIGVENKRVDNTNDFYYQILKHTNNNDNSVIVNIQRNEIETVKTIKLENISP